MKIIKVLLFPFQLIALLFIYLYKILISPFFPKSCRYTPSCSAYGVLAIKRFGPIEGIFLTLKRMLRCHPKAKGGLDPVPDNIKGDIKWIL